MSGGSVNNDRSEPVRGGRAVNIAATDHTCTAQTRAIWCGVGGDLKVTTHDGSVLTFAGVLDGSIVPVHARLIWKTGTGAASMLELW